MTASARFAFGHPRGGDNARQLAVGADVDMQKLMGLTGGALHVEFTDRSGRDLANDTIKHNCAVAQEIYGGGQPFELTTLTGRVAVRDTLASFFCETSFLPLSFGS
jgi:porin